MEEPLPYDDLDDVLQSQFDQLGSAIFSFSINDNSSEEEIRALNEHVQREVTTKPILARIMKGNASLLSVACTNLDDEHFHPAIKCLIESNHFALSWETIARKKAIHMIAYHQSHRLLLPWIATNHQGVR